MERRRAAKKGAPAPALRPRRAWAAGALALLALAGSAPVARAQATATTPPPDTTFVVDSRLGVDDDTSTNPAYVGSLYWGIRQANAAVAPNTVDSVGLVFPQSLFNLSILLEDPLPAIDLSASSDPATRVDLDATAAPAFVITTADDVPDDFVLLHVMNGRADLVNVDLQSGLVDTNGDPVALTVRIDPNGTLGFRYDADYAFDENITGGGGVRIESDGVITFSGTNDYTGGTHVVTGRLVGNDASLQGGFLLEADTVLEFRIDDTTQTRFFGGDVAGEGRLLKTGRGTLYVLGGRAEHTGGTEVSAGTLRITPDSLLGDVVVRRDTQLWIEQNGATRFDGVVSGRGSVRKSGATALVLFGANTFTGGLFVQEGDVRGTTATIPGNVTLEAVSPPAPTARIVFDQDTPGTHTGTIAGAGVLRKQGTGRVLRQGVTDVDLVQIVGGTLAGDTVALGDAIEVADPTATAELVIGDRQTFAGTFSGPGNLAKTGVGTLVLGADALHAGETRVEGGVLELGADLPNSVRVRVESGTSLVNTGGRIGRDLENRGTVGTGTVGATLDVGGTALLASGSTLAVALDDTGNASLLAVGGAATLLDPRYALDLSPGDYSVAQSYTILTAGSIAPGSSPGQAIDDLAFVDVVGGPAFAGSTLTLSLQEDFTGLGTLGVTPNQKATAIALEQVTNSGTADARTIRDGLVPLRVAQVPPVLDMLAGETLSGFTNIRIANARYFADAISRRLRARNWELTRRPVDPSRHAGALPAVETPRGRSGPGAWIEPFGLFGDNDGRGDASDMSTDAYGVSGGFDYRLPAGLPGRHSERWRVGIGLGYTRLDVENDTGFMEGVGNSFQSALYGGYRGPHFHAGAAARFAWTDMETERSILFTSVARTADARFQGLEWGAMVEAGGHFGDRRRALLHPLVRFQYIRTEQDGFAESGAGDLSLAVPDLAFDSLLLTLGGRLSRVFTLDGEFGIEPELRAGWTIDYGDRGRHVPATFYAVPGATPFVTSGTEPDRNAITVGLGYVMMVGDVPLLSTHYDVQFGEYHVRHVLSAGLYLRW